HPRFYRRVKREPSSESGFLCEMSKLMKDWKAEKLDPINDVLARWLLMLGMVDRRNGKVYDDIYKELEAIAMKDETLYSALQSWEKLSATPEEIQAYESRVKRILDEEAARREAELEVQEAEQRGEERGEKRGEKGSDPTKLEFLLCSCSAGLSSVLYRT